MEEIASPQPVFPIGSSVTQEIPLLHDGLIPASPSVANTELPSDSPKHDNFQNSAVTPYDIAKTHESVIDSAPAANAVDAIVPVDHSIFTSVMSPTTEDPLTNESHDLSLQGPDATSINPATDSVATARSLKTDSMPAAQTAQAALPLSFPPGVDLQALLNTFAAASLPANSLPAEAQISHSPAITETVPTLLSQPPTLAAATPVAPWQAQHPVQALAVPSPSDSTALDASRQAVDDAAYEQFLVDEKRIMGNTAPHEFEPGSRLFVGNLSIETTSKREIFFIFKKYGKLAQVSLKSTYGFVQFLTGRECKNAMEGEQGIEVGGRKFHLEVSKPQAARGAAPAASSTRRRSRSPARRSPARSFSDRRDPYDPYRTISPPPRRASPGRYLQVYSNRRSPSPRRFSPPGDVPLPARYGSQIPEIQIVVLDESDRTYIYWVETSIRQAGFRVETLFLSPRLGLPAVVRQMVKEGVLAIVQCNRQLQMMNKVSLQVFDRSQGFSNVRFDEYAGLDMATAIGLLKRTQQQAVAPPPPPPAPQQANIAAMIAQMDPASLQQVIGALSQQQNQQNNNPGFQGYHYRR